MKLAIYAHFSPCDRIVTHAWQYLNELLDLGFKVIFVSNSLVCIEDEDKLKRRSIEVIFRDNVGLDFGMWKSALAQQDMRECSELLLTNSSVIGPLAPLAPIFEEAKKWNCDFWGLTDSFEMAPHLQSYFIVMRKRVIISDAFRSFWESVLPYQSKYQIIRSYELGLTVWLEENGFSWRPLIYQMDVWKSHHANRSLLRKVFDKLSRTKVFMDNTTLSYPALILQMGFPFIKSSLLTSGSNALTPQEAVKILEAAYNSRL